MTEEKKKHPTELTDSDLNSMDLRYRPVEFPKVLPKELLDKIKAKIKKLTKEHVAEKQFAESALKEYGSELAGDVFNKAKDLGEKIAILYEALGGKLNLDTLELHEAQLRVLEDELEEKRKAVEEKKAAIARLKKAKELLA